MQSGGDGVGAITLDKNGDTYMPKSYWVPRDGAYYSKDLKQKFPTPAFEAWEKIEETALSHNEMIAQLESEIAAKLKENAR